MLVVLFYFLEAQETESIAHSIYIGSAGVISAFSVVISEILEYTVE